MDASYRPAAVALLTALALLACGCVGIDPQARALLQRPTDCAAADSNIETLEAARAGDGTRFTQFWQAVLPPVAILSILRDIFIGEPYRSVYLDHWRVAFGVYNDRIDKRVEALENCP